jgi:hypothetical protein
MTALDFTVDEVVLRQDRSADPAHAPAAALQETYLVMPTRLTVDNVEMLALPRRERIFTAGSGGSAVVDDRQVTDDPWLRLPLLHVATVGPAALDNASASGSGTYTLPGVGSQLRFDVDGSFVTVTSDLNGRAQRVPTADVQAAFRQFARRVRHLVRERVPELLDHPAFVDWLAAPD